MDITRDTRSLDYSSCKDYRGVMKGLCADCTAKNPSYNNHIRWVVVTTNRYCDFGG